MRHRDYLRVVGLNQGEIVMSEFNRRDFLKLAGLGGVVFASGLRAVVLGEGRRNHTIRDERAGAEEFYFVQLSDTHWGFDGPKVNPDAQGTLKKAVAAVNSLEEQPEIGRASCRERG